MFRMIPLFLMTSISPALAGAPGTGKAAIAVGAGATVNMDARSPVGVILDGRAELPVGLHLRMEVSQFHMPDKDVESFMLSNAVTNDDGVAPSRVAWSDLEARFTGAWGLNEAQRDGGLRARAGGLLIVGGSAGASSQLEPLGWQADMTRYARLGPSASIGWAIPLGDKPSDPLIDVRLAGSFAIPLSTGGGAMAGTERDDTLTIDDETYGSASLIGSEARLYGEATIWLDAIMLSAELGLEQNTQSRLSRARDASDNWDEAPFDGRPAPHLAIKAALVF